VRYLGANLLASGGASVVGEGATVDGQIHECVVWPGARVAADERLERCIRLFDGQTVQAVAA
jgi:ADP-glucose pyrophosphorylase